MTRHRIDPQSGTAFELRKGQRLRVIDPLGEQVSDLTAFGAADRAEWLSSGRTMLTIVRDTVGRHDFLYTPCSDETFTLIYKHDGAHPSCFGNLSRGLAAFGIPPDRIPTTFNIFMNVELSADGRVSVKPPRSRAGDCIELRAEMDLVVGLTACSAEMSNNYRFKPIDYEIDG
jgi:uncharacterized protein YcgI (DUF1989 family)